MKDTKVLSIDAKVSRPDLDLQLGLSDASGLCAATRAQRENLPHCFGRVAETRFYRLPLGQTTRHDGDAMDLPSMHRPLMGLRRQFDWNILDGPGIDTPADASLVTL